jgi:hypothetical protein
MLGKTTQSCIKANSSYGIGSENKPSETSSGFYDCFLYAIRALKTCQNRDLLASRCKEYESTSTLASVSVVTEYVLDEPRTTTLAINLRASPERNFSGISTETASEDAL